MTGTVSIYDVGAYVVGIGVFASVLTLMIIKRSDIYDWMDTDYSLMNAESSAGKAGVVLFLLFILGVVSFLAGITWPVSIPLAILFGLIYLVMRRAEKKRRAARSRTGRLL